MSFHKCWNLALALLTYNDILVYGQYIYLLSISIVWIRTVTGEKFASDSMILIVIFREFATA